VLHDLAKQEDSDLFIDELHTMVGAGKAEGSMDAATCSSRPSPRRVALRRRHDAR